MARKTIHCGIGLHYLRERVVATHNQGGLLTQGDKPVSEAEALATIDGWLAEGKTITNNCPTPDPDGGCPGHPVEAQG